jgi:hypothetical protein
VTNPLPFTWSGADPSSYVTIQVASTNPIYNSVLQCNAKPSAGTFTVPASLLRALFPGPVTLSLSSSVSPASFSATGLDAASLTVTTKASVQTTLQPPVQ